MPLFLGNGRQTVQGIGIARVRLQGARVFGMRAGKVTAIECVKATQQEGFTC